MFIKLSQRNWATKNTNFMVLRGPALIQFSGKEFFHCKCNGNICLSGSFGRTGREAALPNVYYLAITLKYVMLQLLASWNPAPRCAFPPLLTPPSCAVVYSYLVMVEKHYLMSIIKTSAPFAWHVKVRVDSWIWCSILARADHCFSLQELHWLSFHIGC